tara:strand:- start:533 stop:976 length:444 start_codon:yes stop_codon:yes gene_type:complete
MSIHNLGPYSNVPSSELAEVAGFVSQEDKRFMRSLDPTVGSINFIVSTLWHSIVKECKENGVTYYSPDNLAQLQSIVRNRASARLARTGLQQNGPSAASIVHPTNPGASNLPTNLRQSTSQGVGRGGSGDDRSEPKKGKKASKERSE